VDLEIFVLQRFDNKGLHRLHYIEIVREKFRRVRWIDDDAFTQGRRSVVGGVRRVHDSMDVEMRRSVSLTELDVHLCELVPLVVEVNQSITEFVRVVFGIICEMAP